jgi:UDP-galactopyranose mutase
MLCSPFIMHIGMAGAGISCAVIARELAAAGHDVEIFESRGHLAGNCHTERDAETGVMLHACGPHIFHTDDDAVWAYVNRYAGFRRYVHRVRAVVRGEVFRLPINLHTINQFFGRSFTPQQAEQFIAQQADRSIAAPRNFEEQALQSIGRELYEAFFKGYTQKQWGLDPAALPANVFNRLPIRFSDDDRYFSHRHQGIPAEGYTAMVAAMLEHPKIRVQLHAPFAADMAPRFDHVFYSGPLDGYYGYDLGRLPYRTLRFERFDAAGDHQGCTVMNYCDSDVPYTRITEHKHFAPWERHERTVCFREYSGDCGPEDIPYYPVQLAGGTGLLEAYLERSRRESRVSFVGRLGAFRYMDMDVAVRAALDAAARFLA